MIGGEGSFLTDHGTCAGLHSFSKAMKKADLYAGYGLEAYQAKDSRKITKIYDSEKGKDRAFKKGEDSFHLILLAKDNEGFRNLCRISDESHRSGFYYDPRLDWELLEKYKEGLICTTACMGSLPNQALMENGDMTPFNKLHRIFGDDLFIELHTYGSEDCIQLNHDLVQIANEKSIPVIFSCDAHYAVPDQYLIHEAMLCAQYNEKLDELKNPNYFEETEDGTFGRHHPPVLYLMSEEEVRQELSYLPQSVVDESISNSELIRQKCRVDFGEKKVYLPKFKSEEDSRQMFIRLIEEGIIEKYGEDASDEVWDRAETEMRAILDAGLHDYFLIMWDICHWTDLQGIMRGPARGSAGGALIANALDITSIDPIRYNLQFERFWNAGRSDGLPDIDIDFQKSRIKEVRQYVIDKYGDDKVLRIANHMRIQPKSAIDKAGMVLYEYPPYSDMDKIKRTIETTDDAGQIKPWNEMWDTLQEWADKDSEPHPLLEWEEKHPDLFDLARGLSGRLSGYGVHASAIVISSVPLKDHLPARSTKDDDSVDRELVTQADMKGVEDAGFVKFDFLGLRTLDTLMESALLSGQFGEDSRETRIAICKHFRNLNPNHLSDSCWEQIDKKHTLGIFQIEQGNAARKIGKDLKPRNIEDLGLIVALNRPGPLRMKTLAGRKMIEQFMAIRQGLEDPEYPHEILVDILEKTYGMFVYQESIIAYFSAIGYSLSDADHIRKILGKKLVKEMEAEIPKYLSYAEKFMSKAQAESIWQFIEEFSKYSFNKSHSIGYAYITAWTMYGKWKWPTEFIMASIITDSKKVAEYVREAKRIQVKVLPPNVNKSEVLITKDENTIVYGLVDIKGIGSPASEWIIQSRPFESIESVIEKIQEEKGCPCNKGHLQKFIDSGAFDDFGYRLAKCENCKGTGKVPEMAPKKSGDGLKRVLSPCTECKLGYVRTELPSEQEKMQEQEEFLGIVLLDPNEELIEQYQSELDNLDLPSEADIEEKREVQVAGVITDIQLRKTGQSAWTPNAPFANVTIEWKGDEITFVAWPEKYEAFKFMLKKNALGAFTLITGPRGPRLEKGKVYT